MVSSERFIWIMPDIVVTTLQLSKYLNFVCVNNAFFCYCIQFQNSNNAFTKLRGAYANQICVPVTATVQGLRYTYYAYFVSWSQQRWKVAFLRQYYTLDKRIDGSVLSLLGRLWINEMFLCLGPPYFVNQEKSYDYSWLIRWDISQFAPADHYE